MSIANDGWEKGGDIRTSDPDVQVGEVLKHAGGPFGGVGVAVYVYLSSEGSVITAPRSCGGRNRHGRDDLWERAPSGCARKLLLLRACGW